MSFGEVFRILSLGIVNIIGIIVPGLLFVVLAGLCVVMPLSSLYFHLSAFFPDVLPDFAGYPLLNICELDKKLIAVFVVIISYVLGYVLRLGDIDFLDEKSEKHVWKRMAKEKKLNEQEAAQKDHWVCWPKDPSCRFPYWHTKEYLEARGLNDQALLVVWNNAAQLPQRSKAVINGYKLEVLANAPNLSAVIESNEAHIRLLFGVWQVARMFFIFSVLVFVLCIMCVVAALLTTPCVSARVPPWAIIGSLQLLIMAILLYVKTRIVQLFHYQRVRELTQILSCTCMARQVKAKRDKDGKTD